MVKRTGSFLMPVLVGALLSVTAWGGLLEWDADGMQPVGGGGGGWATALPQWYGPSGYQLWNNAALDDILFQYTAGTVVTELPMTVRNITFNASGYIIGASATAGYGAINLGGAPSIITVTDPTGVATGTTATIVTPITGSGGLTKAGPGILILSNNPAALPFIPNTYAGDTTVSTGTLRATVSNVIPDGMGRGNVSVAAGATLEFNSTAVISETINALLGAGTINNANTGATTLAIGNNNASGTFSGVMSNTAGTLNLVKIGAGTQTLTGANTYTGTTTLGATGSTQLRGGTLELSGASGRLASAAANTLGIGSTLRLSNTATANNPDRLGAGALTMAGATLEFRNDASNIAFSEAVGALTLASGGSTIRTDQAGAGGTSTLTFAAATGGLTRSAGATVNFVGAGLGADARNRIVFTTAPTLDDGIMGGWATVNSADFATYAANSVTALTTYDTGPQSGWTTASNVRLASGTTTLTATRAINSLNLAQTADTTLDIVAGQTLRVETGGILVSGAYSGSIVNGTLTAGTGANAAGELVIHQYSPNPFTISSTIADNGTGVVRLTKAGDGTLVLSGAQTYTGATTINAGTLRLSNPPPGAPTSPVAANLLYWLDPSNLSTLWQDTAGTIPVTGSGQAVARIDDLSGNARNFTQATAANRPVYFAGALNGLGVLRFDDVDDRLSYTAAATSPQSVFIVNRVSAFTFLDGIWGSDNPADTGIREASATTWQHPGNANDFTNPSGSAMFINGVAGNSFGSLGTPHVLEAIRASAITFTTTHLGGYYTGRYLGGDVGEVLVYGTAPTPAERIANESYLLAKWLGIQPGVLPSTTAVTLNAGTLDLNGVNQTIGSLAGAAGSSVALGGGTLTVGTDNSSTAFGGTITGSGNLVKMGGGALQLLAPNSYTGTTTVRGGVLVAHDPAAIPGAVVVNAGGELAIANFPFSNALTLNAGGTLSARTYIPPFATPPPGSTPYTTTITSPITIGGNFTVAVRDYAAPGTGAVINLMSNLSGSGNLSLTGPTAGSGTLILAGDNSGYSGNFTVGNLAVLELLGTQARGTGAVTLLGGGTVRTSVDQSQTAGTLGPDGVTSWYYNFGSSAGNTNRFASDTLVWPARVFSRTDPAINFTWNPGTNPWGGTPAQGYPTPPMPNFSSQGIHMGMLSRGIFYVATPGDYTFYAGSDDPGFLYIDGLLVASPNFNEISTSPIRLAAGWHSIVMRMTQGTGGGGMAAYYSGPDTTGNKILVGGIPGTLKTGSLTPVNLGPLTVSPGTGTVDMAVDTSLTSLTMASGTGLTVTSPGLYNLSVDGATTLQGGTATFSPTTGAIIFNAPIGQTTATAVTISGGYQAVFNAPNTYTGLTTVSSGQLVLNATGGNAIPAAGLTINAANADGLVSNVRLLRSDQIADTATVTMTDGILDLGANNETIATLAGAPASWWKTRVIGAGTLTAGSVTLTQGEIAARLHTTGGINRNTATAGPLILSGDNTYTGQTLVGVPAGGTASLLNIRSNNALGATGAGNDTIVYSGAQLQTQGGLNSPETISIRGIGIQDPYLTAVAGTGALRNVGGNNTLSGPVSLAAAATIQSDTGNLTLASLNAATNALTLQGAGDITFSAAPSNLAAVTKGGPGAVIFGYDVGASIPAGSWTWNAGVLGFSGTQNLGAVTIGATAPAAATTWRFNSDPGAGTTLAVPAGTVLQAGYAIDQTFLGRIAAGSAGTLALMTDDSNNLDFAALPSLSLGAAAGSLVTYSGALTPGAAGYNLGGGGGRLVLGTALTGPNTLQVNGDLTLTAPNTFTGAVTLNAGTTRIINNDAFGNPANVVTLNGGTLQLANTSEAAGALYMQVGNVVGGGARTIVVGAGGGTIDVPARASGFTGAAIVGPNALTGSGTLTKTGLGFLFVTSPQNFSGSLVIGPNGNQVDIRGQGAMPNIASVTINQSSFLNVDNWNRLMLRQYPGGGEGGGTAYPNDNRFNDAATISLQGGRLMYVARNVALGAGTSTETFGPTTVGFGQSEIRAERTGGGGADMIISNLIRTYGGGTVRFTAGGTIGQTGDSGRILLTQLNGVAPTNNQFIGGWGVVDRGFPNFDFAAYVIPASIGATGGVGHYGGTGFPAYATTFASGNITNQTADVTLPAGGGITGALRMAGAATRNLSFTAASDTLYIESGGILADGNDNIRNIGTTATRGRLTAGTTTATTPQELFLHGTRNVFNIHSVIIDNPNSSAATVRVIKDLDGQVNLTATNTYTGGTLHLRGTLEAQAASALGLGPVTVKNSRLNLNVAGAIGTGAASGGFTAVDQGEIYLNNATAAFTTTWDRFVIGPGCSIIGPAARNADQGLNSLTRVYTTPTAGGQIQLMPDAIVGHQSFSNDPVNAIGVHTIKNLGTAADLYLGLSTDPNPGVYTSVTIGAGTPWKGISTDRTSRTWQQGAIIANSDFYLQGLLRDNALAVLNLGSAGNHIYSIVNNAGKPINAYVIGQVALNDDVSPSMPDDLTFVVTPGAIFQPLYSNSLGSPSMYPGTGYADIRVQAGGTLHPGNFVHIGFAANQPYNVAYPVPGPLNGGLVTIEPGGRLWINNASGIGSGQAGNITMKTDSIMHLGTANAFFGMDPVTRMINPGQFVYEPGAIIRMDTSNVYGMSQFVSAEPNGDRVVYEIYNADRTLTNIINPFILPAPGSVLAAPENITIANGGMMTNDSNDRSLWEGRGRLILGDGAVLAGTNQTYMNIQEGTNWLPGATIYVGSNRWIDGNPKLGAAQFTGPNSNVGDATNTVVVIDGAQLSLGASNTFPDSANISLPAAVTFWPPATNPPPGAWVHQPGNGSTLLLNNNVGPTVSEVVGTLTGNGGVIANQDSSFIVVGWGATSDFTFGGVFRSTASNRNPGLVKVGPTKMTLTGTSDSLADLYVLGGELALAGSGAVNFTNVRVAESGTLTLDNSGTPLNNRLAFGGTTRTIYGSGGTINLIGNAVTPVTETIATLRNDGAPAGSMSYLNVTPGAATTTFAMTTLHAPTVDGRQTTWVFRTPAMGNLPGTYDANNVYTPNPGNLANGLITATTPNLFSGVSQNQTANTIAGAIGTPVVMTRPDILGTTNPAGQGVGFVTQDRAVDGFRLLAPSEYMSRFSDNMIATVNVLLPSGARNTSGDTRIQSLTMAPGSTLNINGTLPLNTTPSRFYLYSSGILVQPGGAATIGSTGGTYLQSPDNMSLYLHTQGGLNLNAIAYSPIGIVKTGAGTLNFGPGTAGIWRGTMTIDDGAVNLAANNSFMVTRGQWTFRGQNLHMNGGTLDLGGNSQIINALNSANWLPNMGGTITSATPATLTIQAASTFSGNFTGALSLDKVDNTTALFTGGPSTITGSLGVRQGTLQLRDEARFPNISSVDINYATLLLENGYLAAYSNRINPAASVTMRGGTLDLRGGPGVFVQESFPTLTLAQGQNTININAGGSGAGEIVVGNLVRSPGTFLNLTTGYGFIGTPGTNTTAARLVPANINGVPTANTNGIIGGWAIVGGDHFATYLPGQGIGALSNTADGYANYDSGDVTQALPWQNVNDGASRTIPVSRTVNAVRNAPNAANTWTIAAGQTLTIGSGGLLTNNNNVFIYTGGFLTSGTNELDVWVQQNTTTVRSVIADGLAGPLSLVKGGGGNLQLEANNTYTGTTFVDGGTLTLNRTGANATTDVAVPGNLVIHNATVTETIAHQIRNTADVTLYGGGVLNLMNAAVTERLNSLTLINNGGGTTNNVPIVTRTAAQAAGILELTAANAITAVCDNSISIPTIGGNVGTLNFVRGAGNPQTIDVTGTAMSPLGLVINSNIGTVPTGVAEGGLIKTGTGMLTLGGTASTFGSPASATDVFNVSRGIVRVDAAGALGSNLAVTTVQNGAVLLTRANPGTVTGSIRLKAGSTLGTSEGDATFGAATTTIGSQSVLNVVGDSTICVGDYFLQGWTTGYTINLNSKLTGSGNINVIGPQMTTATGTLRLGNNITDDPVAPGITPGANDYSGTITLNPNTVLLAQATATAVTGNQLGTGTVRLAGGTLALRDDLTGSNLSINYGNNVILSAHSFMNANRIGTTNTGNTITMGALTVPSGAQALTTTFTGSSYWTVNNSYQLAFASLDGAGTFIKGGHQVVNINSIAPTFSGNIVVAGPQGIAVQPSAGLSLPAATTTLQNFTVDGIHHANAGTTLNVLGTLRIGDNAGQVVNGTGGVTTGSVTGALLVPNTTTINANILDNSGIIGTTGGAVTLTATTLRGTGVYQTVGQPITLIGSLADGATASGIKTAGNSTVNFIPGALGTSTGLNQVQGGTLRVAPTSAATNPFGTGDIQVLGYAPPTVTAATSATLIFDGGANAIVQNSNIVNSGLVRIQTGSVTVGGTISGPGPNGYVPGLLESLGGTWNATTPQNTGGYGIKLEPRMGNMNVVTQNPITGWGDNHTWVYSGQFYDADGFFSFIENIDDNTYILIDGVPRLSSTGSLVASTATTVGQRDTGITAGHNAFGGTLNFGMGPNNDGWHTIEIRFNNGGGGAGPWATYGPNGFANNFGFGLNTDGTRALDGAVYTRPIDPGNGSLFRTPVAAQGNIQIDPGASLILTAPGVTHRTNNLAVGGAGTATLNMAPTSSLELVGDLTGLVTSTLNLVNANLVFNSSSAQRAAPRLTGTGSITKLGGGTLTMERPNNAFVGPTFINEGTVVAAGTGLGTGTVTVALGATLSLSGLFPGGLRGEYYNVAPPNPNTNFNTLATMMSYLDGFTPNLIANSSGAGATFDFGTTGSNFPAPYNSGATNFQVRWLGKFNAPVAGNYSFWTGSDDGSMLWINALEPAAVNNNFFQSFTWRGGTAIPLTAGLHDIVVGFYQGTGGYGLQADVQGPAGSGLETRQRIPSSYLFSGVSGDLTVGALAGAGNVILSSFTLTTGGNNADTLFSGVISGAGRLTKTGAGAMTLAGANTYTGPTSVLGGSLFVDGSITSNVTVSGGARIGGSGVINGTVTVNGRIGAGTQLSTGVLSLGDLTMTSSSILEVAIAGLMPGSGYDQINVQGLVTLAGMLDLNLMMVPSDRSIFWLIVNDGLDPILGQFDGLPQDAQFELPGSILLKLTYVGDAATNSWYGGNDFGISLEVIPEPGTLTLLALGGLALLRRRRRSQAR